MPFENCIYENYLYPFVSLYINQLTQRLNLLNIFDSTAHPNNTPLTAKLEPLFAN